jgi:hypothetical protein
MKDPYKVLNISKDATDEEVKKAYRELARKYHPDNYAGNPLSDLVEEKMKEINEAYDQIQKERSGHGGYYGNTGDSGTGFIEIRNLINAGRYSDADVMLNSVSQSDRNAEWNFLKGVVLIKRGWYHDAQKYLETACYMAPDNAEYRNVLNQLRNTASSYGGGYRTSTYGSSSPCDICTTLLCADCMCECCGGDLIPCC